MTVAITANHFGYFTFKLCPKQSASELVTQDCLNNYNLTVVNGDGTGLRYLVDEETVYHYPIVKLPDDVSCDNCVIQWTYVTGKRLNCHLILSFLNCNSVIQGNSWGNCDPTPAGFLCGPQEWFVNCADVKILPTLRFNRRK